MKHVFDCWLFVLAARVKIKAGLGKIICLNKRKGWAGWHVPVTAQAARPQVRPRPVRDTQRDPVSKEKNVTKT